MYESRTAMHNFTRRRAAISAFVRIGKPVPLPGSGWIDKMQARVASRFAFLLCAYIRRDLRLVERQVLVLLVLVRRLELRTY